MLAARIIKLLKVILLLVRVNDELLDIFREHCQSLILLRVRDTSCKLDVLRRYDEAIIVLLRGPCPTTGAGLEPLSLIETLCFGRLGKAMSKVWTQLLVLLRSDLSPRILKNLLGRDATFRTLLE